MRIGIVSDTHGLLRREVIEGLQGVDHIIWNYHRIEHCLLQDSV